MFTLQEVEVSIVWEISLHYVAGASTAAVRYF